MARAEYGDIIYTKHKAYKHYGIYINRNCVIHYDGKVDDFWLRDMSIKETTIDRFLAGADKYYIYRGREKYCGEETVTRAKSKLGEEKFDLIFHNCEHFAMWCKNGMECSSQVNLISTLVFVFILYLTHDRKYSR